MAVAPPNVLAELVDVDGAIANSAAMFEVRRNGDGISRTFLSSATLCRLNPRFLVLVFQVDDELRRVYCEFVPRLVSEREFWRRYLLAVAQIQWNLEQEQLQETERSLSTTSSPGATPLSMFRFQPFAMSLEEQDTDTSVSLTEQVLCILCSVVWIFEGLPVPLHLYLAGTGEHFAGERGVGYSIVHPCSRCYSYCQVCASRLT